MKKIKILLTSAFVVGAIFTPMAPTKYVLASSISTSSNGNSTITMEERVTTGVYIDDIHIGGMTVSEAQQTIEDYVSNLRSKKVTLIFDGQEEVISLGELEYAAKDNDFITEALEMGKSGNLIKRYKELKDIEYENLIYHLEFSFNEEKLQSIVESYAKKYNVAALNASMRRENGQFIYTDEKSGKTLDEASMVKSIKEAILISWDKEDITLTASMDTVTPEYTREVVERANDKLGTFTTTYTSSSADRAGNLANGARLINNTVLYPGDVFSAYEILTPFTTDNGYFEAGAYANGKVVDSIGGGACQVTTTLYNALLFSEMEIVERASHSMTIGYADLSRDAAIAGTWKDLKFRNDKEVPILIEVYTQGRTITFNIWGEETRPTSRTIKYESVILSEIEPGVDVITTDETKPTSYKVTTQSPHTGYTAELVKVVYENGVEVERTRVNKSTYLAAPRYVTVGSKVEEIVPVDQEITSTDANQEGSKNTNKNTMNKSGTAVDTDEQGPIIDVEVPAKNEETNGDTTNGDTIKNVTPVDNSEDGEND